MCGIYMEYSSPHLRKVDISNNFSYDYGGGIYSRNSSPYIFNNIIHSGNDAGVIYDDNSGGKIESNDIYNNSFAGIEIKGTSNPSILSNQIHAGKEAGILVHESGRGMITGNDIFDNNFAEALFGLVFKTAIVNGFQNLS